jgi:hypothetical protein
MTPRGRDDSRGRESVSQSDCLNGLLKYLRWPIRGLLATALEVRKAITLSIYFNRLLT